MEIIAIAGRLGEDAKVKEFEENVVLNFSVAVSGVSKGAKATSWYSCALWRKKGKAGLADFLKKGQPVSLSGRPRVEVWLDTQNLAAGSHQPARAGRTLCACGQPVFGAITMRLLPLYYGYAGAQPGVPTLKKFCAWLEQHAQEVLSAAEKMEHP
jgi:hypothetical protein